jgi:carotenoid cleavage dioxygenase-like enzyme
LTAGFDQHPMLSGIHEPIADERDERDLEVSGEVPRELRGTFLRNGPNARFPPADSYHVFDGDGMLHALTFEDGAAHYRNRWIRTPGLALEEREGHALFGGMTNPGQVDPAIAAEHGSPLKNVANTHVVRHAGRILCLWEAGLPTEVGPGLETLGQWDFDGRFQGPMTAHPKFDPRSGEMLFFGYSPIPPYLRYHEVDSDGKLVRSLDLDLPAPTMIHDFVTTSEHVIFLDAPAVFDFEGFAKGGPMLRWKAENGARLGVMPRKGGAQDLRWFEIAPCYVVHFLNAWTSGTRITIDGCRLDSLDLGLENDGDSFGEQNSYLTRWSIDLETGSVSEERIGELPGEFPRVADAVVGRQNRYGYLASGATGHQNGGEFDCIVKYDLERSSTEVHRFGEGKVCGEPIFATDPTGNAEDDGWLLTYVIDRSDCSTQAVVLDARHLADPPLARIAMPRRLPFGFHGSWLPQGSRS